MKKSTIRKHIHALKAWRGLKDFAAKAWRWLIKAAALLKLNPMFYVCNGYRDAWLTHQYFWEHPKTTLAFWVITLALILLGSRLFRKLSPQFADVL